MAAVLAEGQAIPDQGRCRALARKFSRLLAENAERIAWVVSPNAIGNPGTWVESHPESVWVEVELRLLKENPKIIQITGANADSRSQHAVYWQRPQAETTSVDRWGLYAFLFGRCF